MRSFVAAALVAARIPGSCGYEARGYGHFRLASIGLGLLASLLTSCAGLGPADVQRPAYVTIVSAPPAATVRLDGRYLPGETPLFDIAVPPGFHVVEIHAPAHEPVLLQRRWSPGVADRINVELRSSFAAAQIASNPTPSVAIVPAESSPEFTPTPTSVMATPEATHRVEVEGSATETPHQPAPEPTITPAAAEEGLGGAESEATPVAANKAEVTPEPQPALVRFEIGTEWDEIVIDGERAEIESGAWLRLAPGTHVVRAYRGDERADAELRVDAGARYEVALKWRRWKPDRARFAPLPAGQAILGSDNYAKENPRRTVAVRAFWMARTEVTVADYRACVGAGACGPPGQGEDCNWSLPGHEDHPINCVNVADAETFAHWLGASDGLSYRLPTCAEWERAARGTAGRRYPWGQEPELGRCNTCDRSCRFQHFKNGELDDGWRETAPAGALEKCRSPEGLLDLVGNVAEWCRRDGGGAEVRGGGWGQIGAFLDPSFASARPASDRDPLIGFRLAVGTEDSVEKRAARSRPRAFVGRFGRVQGALRKSTGSRLVTAGHLAEEPRQKLTPS